MQVFCVEALHSPRTGTLVIFPKLQWFETSPKQVSILAVNWWPQQIAPALGFDGSNSDLDSPTREGNTWILHWKGTVVTFRGIEALDSNQKILDISASFPVLRNQKAPPGLDKNLRHYSQMLKNTGRAWRYEHAYVVARFTIQAFMQRETTLGGDGVTGNHLSHLIGVSSNSSNFSPFFYHPPNKAHISPLPPFRSGS